MQTITQKPTEQGQIAVLRSGDLFGALAMWRKCEKRHAMMTLGEIPATLEQRDLAKENADRALHNVRKLADDVPALLAKWQRLATFNEQCAADGKKRGQTPKGVCVHRGYAEGVRALLADLSSPNIDSAK